MTSLLKTVRNLPKHLSKDFDAPNSGNLNNNCYKFQGFNRMCFRTKKVVDLLLLTTIKFDLLQQLDLLCAYSD